MILTARESLDQSYRTTMYKACLDIVVDWAVEVPVYQRQNAIIFSTERVNIDVYKRQAYTPSVLNAKRIGFPAFFRRAIARSGFV